MATEPTTQEVNVTQSAENEPRTFTQEEVNRIVSNRVAKYADYEEMKTKAAKFDEAQEAAKSDLQKAQEMAAKLQAEVEAMRKQDSIRSMREEVSRETGVPVSLLTYETEEQCKEQARMIMDFGKQTPGYPSVRDGGEAKTATKGTAKQQFEEWAKDALI